mgnify:CR=1 FL=1
MTKPKEGMARDIADLPAGMVSPQRISARDRSLPGKVTGRLKRALDAIVWQGLDRADAAVQAGMTDHSLRVALGKPHITRYLKEQVKVRRAAAWAKNQIALEEIRDQGESHLARVQAVKVMHGLDADEIETTTRAKTPGIVIVVNGAASVTATPSDQLSATYPTDDDNLLIEHEDGPQE